ncbi:nucleolar protein 12 [Odontesthes bonariensis]|uniref:nucleolar protein 12 n=1 Tax=Odontesthes bonariensis TaxID=219752 RepID=UPI003F58AEFA
MKNTKNHKHASKNAKFKPGSKRRENKCVVTFDDKDRQDYLTGFHKRKVERRKAAVDEMRKKIKEEQKRVREERHKEYVKMLKEREEALADVEGDLEDLVTSKTESLQYDHPNHTVTVTTISDLDLSRAHLLGSAENQAEGDNGEENKEREEKTHTMPKKAGNPIVNKKIRTLTAALNTYTCKRKRKGKQEGKGGRGRPSDNRSGFTEKKRKAGKTGKSLRRRRTGKKIHHQD